MGLNLVDNTNYGFVGEKVGTFTPNFTPASGSHIEIKQVGNVVFIAGFLGISGTWEDVSSNHFGDITNVDVPAVPTFIPVLTSDGTNLHPGTLAFADGNGLTYIGMGVNESDQILYIDGFYFTA